MKHILALRCFIWIAVAICLGVGPSAAQSEKTTVVGRITEITGGELLRYDGESGEWVALVPDSPFGIDDVLYTDERARAEILVPNGTLVRLDSDTRIVNITLDEHLTHLQLSSGLGRLVSGENGAQIEVLTDFGRVLIASGGSADVAAAREGATVTAIGGDIEALTESGETYRIQSGEALMLTGRGVVLTVASTSPDWSDWNLSRDRIWAERAANAPSSRYIPPSLAPYAYELDSHGEWRAVYYGGAQRWLWHPTRIDTGWSPFTHGRWVTWYGDPCWIPAEPFGYVTHHYGSWEFINGLWFWVPPGLGVTVGLSEGWYPGRVGWVSHEGFIGWYPLLWYEPWYAHRHWGLHSRDDSGFRPDRHHHASRVIVVENRHFYHSRSYAEHPRPHVDPLRFKPDRGPHELKALRADRGRFRLKDAPALHGPPTVVTSEVRHTIEGKRKRPSEFRPATAGRIQRPPRTVPARPDPPPPPAASKQQSEARPAGATINPVPAFPAERKDAAGSGRLGRIPPERQRPVITGGEIRPPGDHPDRSRPEAGQAPAMRPPARHPQPDREPEIRPSTEPTLRRPRPAAPPEATQTPAMKPSARHPQPAREPEIRPSTESTLRRPRPTAPPEAAQAPAMRPPARHPQPAREPEIRPSTESTLRRARPAPPPEAAQTPAMKLPARHQQPAREPEIRPSTEPMLRRSRPNAPPEAGQAPAVRTAARHQQRVAGPAPRQSSGESPSSPKPGLTPEEEQKLKLKQGFSRKDLQHKGGPRDEGR